MVQSIGLTHPTLGILGGGQLGKMMCLAARRMWINTIVLDPTADCPASGVADKLIVADFKDGKAISELAKSCDFLTYEIELVNAKALEELESKGLCINPSPASLAIIQDKFLQKKYLQEKGIPVAEIKEVKSLEDLLNAAGDFGYPFVLKASRDSYDGRGNQTIQRQGDLENAFNFFKGRALFAEKWVDFDKEVSIIAARNADGQIECFPLAENHHEDNILVYTLVPARVPEKAREKAEKLARKVLGVFQGGGVFGIEMFVTKKGEVLVNEIAPRPHNSGHYTIEACSVSQFEQHIRGVLNLPLAKPRLLSPVAMVNILGEASTEGTAVLHGLKEALAINGVSLHLYGKKSSRLKRKMGHLTVLDESGIKALEKALKARSLLRMENEVLK